MILQYVALNPYMRKMCMQKHNEMYAIFLWVLRPAIHLSGIPKCLAGKTSLSGDLITNENSISSA